MHAHTPNIQAGLNACSFPHSSIEGKHDCTCSHSILDSSFVDDDKDDNDDGDDDGAGGDAGVLAGPF